MFNQVIILGNLTRDPEVKIIPGLNTKVAKTGIASTRKFKNKAGEQKEETLFIDVVAFGRNAEVMEEYLKKGSKVHIQGKLVFNSWEQDDGVKRSKHEVHIESFQMLSHNNANNVNDETGEVDDSDENVPF